MDSIVRHDLGSRFSRIVVYNGIAFFAGITASDLSGDIRSQTRELLSKADALFAKVSAPRSAILNATVWLRNIGDFAAMNEVWEGWIDKDHPPARATVESRLALPDILVEIQFTVAAGETAA